MRAQRLQLSDTPLQLATATNAADIAASLTGSDGFDIVVIDSIQTMYLPTLESALAQSRKFAPLHKSSHAAKSCGAAVFFVGHVTKARHCRA